MLSDLSYLSTLKEKSVQHRYYTLIDAQPAPVFLEATTDASRRLYERYGFSVVAEVSTLPETLSYAMIREAM